MHSRSLSTKIRISRLLLYHAIRYRTLRKDFGILPLAFGILSSAHRRHRHTYSISTQIQTFTQCARRLPATPAVGHLPHLCCTSTTNIASDKTTWWGCGKHVAGVMDNTPKEQWCTCAPRVEQQGTQYPPMGSLSSA